MTLLHGAVDLSDKMHWKGDAMEGNFNSPRWTAIAYSEWLMIVDGLLKGCFRVMGSMKISSRRMLYTDLVFLLILPGFYCQIADASRHNLARLVNHNLSDHHPCRWSICIRILFSRKLLKILCGDMVQGNSRENYSLGCKLRLFIHKSVLVLTISRDGNLVIV